MATGSTEAKVYHILNLGAGVQSTALYLMSLRQDEPEHVPVFDFAIFADTQEEPKAVYEHLQWLKSLGGPPIIEATAGRLGDILTHILSEEEFDRLLYAMAFNRRLTKLKEAAEDGATRPLFADQEDWPEILKDYPVENRGASDAETAFAADPRTPKQSLPARFASIPAFTAHEEGRKQGIVPRQCTREFKIEVVERVIRREILGLPKRAQIPDDVRFVQYMGLSRDEPSRVAKVKARFESVRWSEPRFPLFDMEMERSDCRAYLADLVPHSVPRSACTFCPYRRNVEWRRLRDEDPDAWQRAVEIDELIRHPRAICGMGLDRTLYLHESCLPLRVAPIDAPESGLESYLFGFAAECEGMCGV